MGPLLGPADVRADDLRSRWTAPSRRPARGSRLRCRAWTSHPTCSLTLRSRTSRRWRCPGTPVRSCAAVRRDLVLVVADGLRGSTARGLPAGLTLVEDSTDTRRRPSRGATVARRLPATTSRLVQRRMLARGVSPLALTAVNLQRDDVATPSGRAVVMLGMVSYFLIFATLIGGMYLAIDSTAGERERKSLEPLLTPARATRRARGRQARGDDTVLGGIAGDFAAGIRVAIPLHPAAAGGHGGELRAGRGERGIALVMLPFTLLAAACSRWSRPSPAPTGRRRPTPR
jgi:hypothetical protein